MQNSSPATAITVARIKSKQQRKLIAEDARIRYGAMLGIGEGASWEAIYEEVGRKGAKEIARLHITNESQSKRPASNPFFPLNAQRFE